MATIKRVERPLLNPVLTLNKKPVPKPATGGGQGEKGIKVERLGSQRQVLSSAVREIAGSSAKAFSGKVHLVARMFQDSLAPSWTPKGLFDSRFGVELVAPARNGYLVEASQASLASLANYISNADSIEARTAISRVESITTLDRRYVLDKLSESALWDSAMEADGGRLFVIWLAPFKDVSARKSVIALLEGFEKTGTIVPTFPAVTLPATSGSAVMNIRTPEQSSVSKAIRRYKQEGSAQAFAIIRSRASLDAVIASGASIRIDPVVPIETMSPGVGAHPNPPLTSQGKGYPTVVVVDGGMNAASYLGLEAWRAPPLVADSAADTVHGNRVTSLVVQAAGWNSNLKLPPLECSFATVQAIRRQGANGPGPTPEMLTDYLRQVAESVGGNSRVWNLSFNSVSPEDDLDVVSYLGHEIRRIARKNGILPIISIGNKRNKSDTRLCAPADCEAAITVGGRSHDDTGAPAGPCPVSLQGPGPDGMLKPDVSWFSKLRMLGGDVLSGSSFSTALVSSLAAHTFSNLKAPSPDLVRALVINSCERDAHDVSIGWGSPDGSALPWACGPGEVVLAWRSELKPGFAYYWEDIPIPPQLIRDGKLHGKAKITAVLDPLVSETGGPNYFATRLQVALQYKTKAGTTGNLLGTMKEDREKELDARADLAKWHPVRRHSRDFSKGSGLTYSGSSFKLHARIFTRDLFQFDMASHHEVAPREAAFVLSFSDPDDDGSEMYNSMSQKLGNFVESAVVEQGVEVTS